MIVPTIRTCHDMLGRTGFFGVQCEFRRLFNATEASTALRPFYFTVHPDLFGQYPEERQINENSLKTLSGYLETLQHQRVTNPVELKFYLRPDQRNSNNQLRSVRLTLRERSLRRTVVSILESCNLPTSHIKLPETPKRPNPRITQEDLQKFHEGLTRREAEFYENDPIIGTFIRRVKKKATEDDHLKSWLERHYRKASDYFAATQSIRNEIDKMKSELCRDLEVKEIKWECSWNISHFRGALQSFLTIQKQHPNVMASLKGKSLIFGLDTGVNLDGHVMLNCGEVRHNWLELLKNVARQDEVLLRLPSFERAVSRVLRDIRVVHRKFQPKVMAGQYENQLRRLTTSLSDHQGRLGYPKTWPSSLSNFELVVETEAGPLMLSPTGQFIVPSSCPSFLLVNFITENLQEARRLLDEYSSNKHVEDRLLGEVTAHFGLCALRKDDNITPSLMIDCCERLLTNQGTLRPLLQGANVFITTYYSLLTDGQLCFPWNWKM